MGKEKEDHDEEEEEEGDEENKCRKKGGHIYIPIRQGGRSPTFRTNKALSTLQDKGWGDNGRGV